MEDVELAVVVYLRAEQSAMPLSQEAIGQAIGESINELYGRRRSASVVVCEQVDINEETVWVP